MLYLQSPTLLDAKPMKTRIIKRLVIPNLSDDNPFDFKLLNFFKDQVNSLESKRFVPTDDQNSVYIDECSNYGSSGKLVNNSEAFERQTLILSNRCRFAIIINKYLQFAS